jgi:hypothetical protein
MDDAGCIGRRSGWGADLVGQLGADLLAPRRATHLIQRRMKGGGTVRR